MNTRTMLRGTMGVLFMTFVLLVAASAVALAQDTGGGGSTGGSTSSPTIKSDKDDYAPGDTVALTGSGWQPGEKVNITVDDDQGKTWSRNVDVTADESGNISDTFNLPDWFVATYQVTATGEQSGVATTSFTDSIAATASVDKRVVFRNQTNTYTFTINNTSNAGESIGSIEIRTPGVTVGDLPTTGTPCGTTQTDWTATRTGPNTCRYQSKSGPDDNIPAGSSSSAAFQFTTSIPDGNDASGAWFIQVKTTDDWSGSSVQGATASSPGALTTSVYSFEVTDAIIVPANSTVTYGGACPTQNKTATAGSSRDIVICGKKHSKVNNNSLTPTSSDSSLSGTMLAENGTFTSNAITAAGTEVVLAKYTGAKISSVGSGKTIASKIGITTLQSPVNTLSGYEATPPIQATSLAVDPASGTYGGSADLKAKLTAAGDNLSGKTIKFQLRGTDVCGVSGKPDCPETGSDGVATLQNVSLSGITAGGPTGAGYAGAVKAIFAGEGNYESSVGTGNLTVNKADAVIDVQGFDGPYDGTAKGASGTATGADDSDLSNLLDLGDTFTNFPGGTANWSFAGNDNHKAASGSVDIKISKAATTTTVTCPGDPFVYNGQNQEPCLAIVSGPGLDSNQSVDVTYANNKNAGQATASASYPGSDNLVGSTNSTTFTIGRAPITVTADVKSKVEGAADPPLTYQVAGQPANGAAVLGDLTRVEGETPGDYAIQQGTVDNAHNDNYDITYVGANLTIKAAPVACQTNAKFQPPFKDDPATGLGMRNTVKAGNVVPVKLSLLDCNNAFVGGKKLEIRVFNGVLDPSDVADGNTAVITESVSAADSGTLMRQVDGQYIYNLSTKGLTTGQDYTIAVKDITAQGATWATVPTRLASAVIQPKK